MAQIESGQSKGRQTNVELNLIPFIDLMSVLITFLLISAVWTQVSMIQIGTSIYGKKTDDKPLVIPPMSDKVLKLDIGTSGYILTIAAEVIQIPKLEDNKFDTETLYAQLQRAKELLPEKIDGIIAIADELPFEELIAGMDQFLKAGFPQVGIATGGAR